MERILSNNPTPDNGTNLGFTLSVAKIAVFVTLNQTVLQEYLSNRYRDFITPDPQPKFAVKIEWSGRERTSSSPDPTISFQPGLVHLKAPGYVGIIDLNRRQAELILSSQQPIEEIDYFLRVLISLLVFDAGGLLFHAAGIVHHSRGYAFFGHSGAGKTTVARFSSSDTVLNDDLVVLRSTAQESNGGKGWQIYATPFWNPTQVKPNHSSATLVGLFRLQQDTRVCLERLQLGQAIGELLSCIPVIPADPLRRRQLLERASLLVRDIPIYRLFFRKEATFWDVIDHSNFDQSESQGQL